MYFEKILPNDWIGVRRNFQKIESNIFGPTATPTFSSIGITDLTASRLVWTNASSVLASKDLIGLVAGTANEINIADDGSGGVTIGIVNPLIVGKGGTGLATLTNHGLLLGSGTGAVTPLAEATNGQIPIGSTGNDPVLATITGTAKRVTVTNTAGAIKLSGPQDLDTVDIPTFAGTIIKDSSGNIIFYVDDDELYFSAAASGVLVTGNPIGLLLALTYNLE